MYTSFTIENFRVFEHIALNDLGRVNLIAGKNNTGKTSLLEALMFHSGTYDYEQLFRMFVTNSLPAFRERDERYAPELDSLFYDFDTSKPIILGGEYNNSDWAVHIDVLDDVEAIEEKVYERLYVRPRLRDMEGEAFQNEPFLRVVRSTETENKPVDYVVRRGNRLTRGLLNSPTVQAEFLSARERVPMRINAKRLSKLIVSRKEQMLVNALKIIDDRLKSVIVLAENEIAGDIGLKKLVSLSSMGDGMGRISSIILAISEASNGILLIDEVENGLYYETMPDLWRAIGAAAEEFNVQIFATTHSLECIQAAEAAFSEHDKTDMLRLHRFNRHKRTGKILATTYTSAELASAVELNFEVR